MSHCYRQLRLDEREALFRMKDARLPVSRIADRRVPGRKLARNPELASYVIDGLHRCWSPEQIAGRLRIACQDDLRVSHETIYQYVYGAEGKRQGLYCLLPWSRRRRRPRRGRKPRGLQIPLTNGIDQRPADIAEREDFGHWEGDLVQFRKVYGKANLTSLVERKSRYAVLWRNPSRSSAGVMAGIDRELAPLPPVLRRTVTFDRGTEFAAYPTLHRKLGMESCFCEPRAPWQKGGVDNFNGPDSGGFYPPTRTLRQWMRPQSKRSAPGLPELRANASDTGRQRKSCAPRSPCILLNQVRHRGWNSPGLMRRQIFRLLERLWAEGASGLVSRKRGRP